MQRLARKNFMLFFLILRSVPCGNCSAKRFPNISANCFIFESTLIMTSMPLVMRVFNVQNSGEMILSVPPTGALTMTSFSPLFEAFSQTIGM
jgi:hypothetical protein